MAIDGELIRAFVSIHPPAAVVEALAELTAQLKRELNDAVFRWVKREQIHLTLQFLGNIPTNRLDDYLGAVDRSVRRHNRLVLKAESLGCFPQVSRPRVLWAGLNGQVQELQRLKADLDGSLQSLGYIVENRPFHPHLTLARVSGPFAKKNRLKELIEFNAAKSWGDFPVDTVHLTQSLLSPKGVHHQSLGSFLLRSE